MEFSDLVESVQTEKRTNLTNNIESYFNKSIRDDSINLLYYNNFSTENFNKSYALERRIELSTEYFLIPERSTATSTTVKAQITKTACAGCSLDGESDTNFLRNETWVIPLLILAGILMLVIACFEIYVLMKAARTTPSRRHLFLGQMLLLGLFACATIGAILAASPTQLTCAVVRFGAGVAYSIVFASLLVKCVFLISLNSGVYLPATYQSLLLLFAILIQVAIGMQWLLTNPPVVDNLSFENVMPAKRHHLLVTADDITQAIVIPLCRTAYHDMLLSLIYVVFLILFVSVLAMKSRSIRNNYRESTYIGLSVLCCIPTWLVWILSGLVLNERYKDGCLAFGLVTTAAIIFVIMFMPKGRQLAAFGKDGVYVEDREEGFSSISRSASGYSPSFFHFKPSKYGFGTGDTQKENQTVNTLQGIYINPEDGNLYTTLEHTLSTNPNVYFQRGNGVHPGMMY